MGGKIVKRSFTAKDYKDFEKVLSDQIEVFREVIRSPGFGTDPLKVGAELEMYLIDDQGLVAPKGPELLELLDDDQFQAEINQYNLELNLSETGLRGKPFTNLLDEMHVKTAYLENVADQIGVNVMPVGILPTLRQEHLLRKYMTPERRYEVLGEQLFKLRGKSFEININAEESVTMACDDVTVEGANTSFQVHMMVEHDRFADTFNAAQLSMPIVTAVSANSSILMGKRVWDEARVALFKQSLDTRVQGSVPWQRPARVSFGQGWIREDAWELFAESVAVFKPLLPVIFEEKAREAWAAGQLPRFDELKLHLGTSWPWHRPVYSRHGSGHVRIEFRSIPAGPTSYDMAANAAFALGLAAGLSDEIRDYLAVIPFRYAEYNFYRAAQNGLDAKILWPLRNMHHPEEVPIIEVIESLYPYAEKGLRKLGVVQSEIDTYLGIVEKRITDGMTGARWQRHTHRHLEGKYGKDEASRMLTDIYIRNARSCIPVAEWERIW